jgi:hypothetical protein
MNPASPGCPKCGYIRRPQDNAPDWQCPACGIAVAKFQAPVQGDVQLPDAKALLTMTVDPPQLPLANRIGCALPELAMAALFLWCWLSPLAWQPTLASSLGSLMLMQFFAMHASVFLAAAAGTNGGAGRLVAALVMLAFYIPIAGAFAYFHGGWTPFAGFAWLLLASIATMLAARGPEEFQNKRMRFYWGAAAGCYILSAFATMLPLPRLGFRTADVFWDKWWAIKPEDAMAWGLLYFGAMGVTKLLETPQMILREE